MNVLEPLPGGPGEWRGQAARALGWLAVARLVSPVAGDVVGSMMYTFLPWLGEDVDTLMVVRGVWVATLVVWAAGIALLVRGVVRLAHAMRGAPKPGPLFELGPAVLLLTVVLMAVLVGVGTFLPDNAAFGLSRAILAPIPPILVLLLAAATFARAREAGLQAAARVLVVVPLGEGILAAVGALTNRSLSADAAAIAILSLVRTGWVLLGEGAIIAVLAYGAWALGRVAVAPGGGEAPAGGEAAGGGEGTEG